MYRWIIILLLIVQLLKGHTALSQPPPLNFHHLTVRNGLNDGIINAIVQDKYGYMWFASYGALNRFNGYTVEKFTTVQGDSSSLPASIVNALYCDSSGDLWIGYDEGLAVFNYQHSNFKRIKASARIRINEIQPLNQAELLLLGNQQLWVYNKKEESIKPFVLKEDRQFFSKHPPFSICSTDDKIYIGSVGGVIICDRKSGKTIFHPVQALGNSTADKIMADRDNNLWVNDIFNFLLVKINLATLSEEAVHDLPAVTALKMQMSFLDFVADDHHNVWIVTSLKGLMQYNSATGRITFHQQNPFLPGSIASNILRTVYRAGDGNIWVSMLGGVDYFDPQNNLFSVIYPFAEPTANTLARGFSKDKQGNYWFTTGDGISKYSLAGNTYEVWKNETGKPDKIYYNSSRAVLADRNNTIWIATGKGINRYNTQTRSMEFLTRKDSLPQGFYLNINESSDGTIWFCSNQNDGLYYYDPSVKRIFSIRNHPVLKKYTGYGVRRVFEDSKKRLWIGFDGEGYAMYDPAGQATRYWYNSYKNDSSIINNRVIDITEDNKGIIWISTFNGIRSVDPTNGNTGWVHTGLKSTITNGLAVDKLNRLWIGSSAGLMMLDSSRKFFTYFDESFGLPSSEFPEHQAHVTDDGHFVFPSNKGYIFFNPLDYKEEKQELKVYISSVQLFDKPYISEEGIGNSKEISLGAQENFFTITLEALNYKNPGQTWYAYRLDGLEKGWHFTQDAKAVYTNVPGGDYVFRYKATANINDWNVPESILHIQVATKFYKTTWFWISLIILLGGLLYFFYRYRIRQQEQLFMLESKTQVLEKEKAMVMYESLKQQLNPHFLFNSLTSLSSLIQSADTKTARDFLDSLSKTYRYILKSRDHETVVLADELKFAENYVRLQKTRFEKGLEVEIRIPEEQLQRKIVPVTLQNLIENAIKHNIIDDDSPLQIEIFTQDDCIIVRNNLQKKNFVETSNKQGLGNLRSLYQYLSQRPVELAEDGNYFTVKIPLL